MIKDILEDLIVLVIAGVLIYFLWTKYLAADVMAAIASAKEGVKKLQADTGTIIDAVKSPGSIIDDLFMASTPYISQAQFHKNIADIQAQLKGRMK